MSEPAGGGPPGFKRLNFFKGLVTYYTDWIDNETFRLDKHRWHNMRCHGPGSSSATTASSRLGRGDPLIEVQPGCAIDGSGNELVLWDTAIKQVRTDGLKLPQTVYIVARYTEELTDFISYKQNLAVRGHRRVLEGCEVDVTPLLPNIARDRDRPRSPRQGRPRAHRRRRSAGAEAKRDRSALCPARGPCRRLRRRPCSSRSPRCCRTRAPRSRSCTAADASKRRRTRCTR